MKSNDASARIENSGAKFKRFNLSSAPERRFKTLRKLGRACGAFHRDQDGGTIFSLLIAVLGLAIMIGFTTNMASETIERERIQRAADSLAYASGLWLARGMNAAASMNHVMGEKSAYSAMFNALAGPEDEFEPCKEEATMTKRLKGERLTDKLLVTLCTNLEDWAPKPNRTGSKTWTITGNASPPSSSQRKNVKKIIENFTDKYYAADSPDAYCAAAALYDAKLRLKYYATDCLNNKAVGTWLMDVDNTPKLNEFIFLKTVGTGFHTVEDFILGTSSPDGAQAPLSSGSINDILNAYDSVKDFIDNPLGNLNSQLKDLGNTILGDYLGRATEVLDAFDKLKGRIEDQISQIQEAADSVTSAISDAKDNLNEIKEKLESVKKGLSDVGNKFKSNPAAAVKDMKKIKDQLSKIKDAVKGVKNNFNNLKSALGKLSIGDFANDISNLTSNLFNKAISSITNLSLNDALEKLNNTFSEYGDKISQVYDDVKGGIDGIKDLINDPRGALTDALGQIASFALGKALGLTTICSERPILLELENELLKTRDVRKELYGSLSKIQKRFKIIVGSKDDDPKDRYLYKNIYKTAKDLKTAYAVDKRDGFDQCTVAPLDTLVPNPNAFERAEKKNKLVDYEDEDDEEEDNKSVSLYQDPNLNNLDITSDEYLDAFNDQALKRDNQIVEILNAKDPVDPNSVDSSECKKAYQDYNDEIGRIIETINHLQELRQEYQETRNLLKELVSNLQKLNDRIATKEKHKERSKWWKIGLCVGGVIITVAATAATGGAALAYVAASTVVGIGGNYAMNVYDDNELSQLEEHKAVLDTLEKINSKANTIGKIERHVYGTLDLAVDAANRANTVVQEASLVFDGEKALEEVSALAKGEVVAGKRLGSLSKLGKAGIATSVVATALDIWLTSRKLEEQIASGTLTKEEAQKILDGYKNNFEDDYANFNNYHEDIWNRLTNLKKPICREDEVEENEENIGKEKNLRNPLLPVLAEEKIKKDSGIDYLANVKAKKWTSTSKSPYGQLPKLPWKGTDEEKLVPNIQKVIRLISYASDAVLAGAVVYYVCQYRFGEAGHAGGILSECLAFQIKGIKSEWEPDTYGHKNNPSVWSYPTKEFDYKKEQTSQWVRASYPVVDTLRSGLRKHYKKTVPISNLSTYLTAWSYRYALSEAYYLKTGAKRPYPATGDAIAPCFQYVIAGAEPEKKGDESFWKDSEVLDQMFSVVAIVQSEPRNSAAGPKVFRRLGETEGETAAAQATFYPANGRNSLVSGNLATNKTANVQNVEKKENRQPYTCWDGLQWKNQNPGGPPIIWASEWWNPEPTMGPNAWDYKQFSKTKLPTLDDSKVELSWETMMTPVTKSRLARAAEDPDASDPIKRAAKNAAEHAPLLAN